MTRPTRQFPSGISAGVWAIITHVVPATFTPSIDPESISNSSATRQSSFVATRAMFDQVHGQIASQEQFS